MVVVIGEGLKMRAPTARWLGRSERGTWERNCALLKERRRASGILGMAVFMVGGCWLELVKWLWSWRLDLFEGFGFVVMVVEVWVM